MTILICTVGSSYQPIEKAIKSLKLQHVIFICSQDNDENNIKGSYVSVNGRGKVNKSSFKLNQADQPNIIILCELSDDQYTIELVDPDDINDVYLTLEKIVQAQNDNLIADYTGGTKTMSAGLAMVAADYNVPLNLVVGTRADHIKVQDGSEESVVVDIQQIRFQRHIKQAANDWQHYNYQQAMQRAASITLTLQNKSERGMLIQLSKAFSAWDQFDHQTANDILLSYKNKIGRYYHTHLTVIKHLIDARSDDTNEKQTYTPYLIIDLWNNAQRKAQQGYYDDATARVYRLLEWTGQWILQKEKGWQTNNLPDEACIKGIMITKNRQNQNQAGLYATWQLVQHQGSVSWQNFVTDQLETMKNHIQIRNNSILAHGYKVITKEQWQALSDWLSQHFLPVLKESANIKLDIKAMQLPNHYL